MNLAYRMSALFPEGAYAVLSRAQSLERQGKSIIHLEIGQPDFPTPRHISSSAITAIKKGKTKYTPPLGIVPLRQAISDNLRKSGYSFYDYKQVAVTPSAKTALFIAMVAVLNPGDEVIMPDPGFPTYHIVANFLGAKVHPIPLIEEKNFRFDMRIFKKFFSKKTKLIILNSPGNPTGAVMGKDNLEEIADIADGTQAWILTDDIYNKILYESETYTSISMLPKMKNRTIIINGFSKTYAMTGWRLGYIVVPERIIDKIDYLLTHTVGCTAAFTQEAGVTALSGSQKSVVDMVDKFRLRRDYIVKELNSIKGVRCQIPGGAFYVFPNIASFKRKSKTIATYLLNHAGVAVLPGTDFGKYGEGYLRLSYANSLPNLREAIRRIKKGLTQL